MSELRGTLGRIVSATSREGNVALLASAGIDSISTGIVCQEVGKQVHAYTYELHGYRSLEREKVETVARHFGWQLKIVTVPTRTLPELKRLTALPDDFVLTGTLSQAAERVCRMVPPLLTKAIAESVYYKVLLPYAEKHK